MNNTMLYSVLAVVIGIVIFGAFYAYGQEVVTTAPDTTVDFSPFLAEVVPYVMSLAAAIVSAALAWIAQQITRRTGIQVEAAHREALQSALMNGARLVVGRLTPEELRLDVKTPMMKEGIEFVLRSVPDAVKYFGLTPEDVERHLKPKLVAATAEVAPVETSGPIVATPEPALGVSSYRGRPGVKKP